MTAKKAVKRPKKKAVKQPNSKREWKAWCCFDDDGKPKLWSIAPTKYHSEQSTFIYEDCRKVIIREVSPRSTTRRSGLRKKKEG